MATFNFATPEARTAAAALAEAAEASREAMARVIEMAGYVQEAVDNGTHGSTAHLAEAVQALEAARVKVMEAREAGEAAGIGDEMADKLLCAGAAPVTIESAI